MDPQRQPLPLRPARCVFRLFLLGRYEQRRLLLRLLRPTPPTAASGRPALVPHRSAVYPGVKPRAYVGRQGEEQFIDVAALDWAGEPLSGQRVQVEIAERRWYSVQEQDATGRARWTTTVEEVPVTSLEV